MEAVHYRNLVFENIGILRGHRNFLPAAAGFCSKRMIFMHFHLCPISANGNAASLPFFFAVAAVRGRIVS
jgi:hypothetical protein